MKTSPPPASNSHLEWRWWEEPAARPGLEGALLSPPVPGVGGGRGEGEGDGDGEGRAAVPGSAAPGRRRYSLGVTNASAVGAQHERRERGGEAAGMLGRGALSPRPCPGSPSARDPRAPRRPVGTEGGHLGAPEGRERSGVGPELGDCPRPGPLCLLPGPSRTRAQQPRGLRPPLGPWGKGVPWAPRDLGAQNGEWPTGPRQGLSLLRSCRTLVSGRPEVCGPGSPTASVFLFL